MRKLEQMTINEVYSTVTLGDIALYGGLLAIGAVAAILFLEWVRKDARKSKHR